MNQKKPTKVSKETADKAAAVARKACSELSESEREKLHHAGLARIYGRGFHVQHTLD